MDVQPTPPEGDYEVVHFDVLALEVLEPGVPIPAYTATNGLAEESIPDFAWFPGPSQVGIPAPSPDVVSYTGDFSGYQVLLNAEMGTAPAGNNGGAGNNPQNSTQPLAPIYGPAIPGLTLPKLLLPVRKGGVSLPLQCTGANCLGNVSLQNIEQPAATIAKHKTSKKKPKAIVYGIGSVNVKARSSGTVKVRLTATGKRATKDRKKLVVWANFTLGSTKLSKQITLTS